MKKQIKYIFLGFFLSVAFLVSPNALSGSLLLLSSSVAAVWGTITGTLSAQTDLNTSLGLKAPIASPTFTGTVTAPTTTFGFTSKSIPYTNASGNFAQDNTYLKWDPDNFIFTTYEINANRLYAPTYVRSGQIQNNSGSGMFALNANSIGVQKSITSDDGTQSIGYFPSGGQAYPMIGNFSQSLALGYGQGETIAIPAAGVIKVKTGTNLSLTADNVALTGGLLIPGVSTSSAALEGTLCRTVTTGNVLIDTTTSCLVSSAKYKQDVEPLDAGITQVMSLRPVSYQLKKEFNPAGLGRQVGFIAEEVAKVDARLVAHNEDGSVHGVRYLQMTALLTRAIQQQQGQIEALTARVVALEKKPK